MKNNDATNRDNFGICFAYGAAEIEAVCPELRDLDFPNDDMSLKTRRENLEYIKEVEHDIYEEDAEGKHGGTLFSYTVKRSTENGAQAGQKVVIYLHDQEILEWKDAKLFRSMIAFALSLGLGKKVHFARYGMGKYTDQKAL